MQRKLLFWESNSGHAVSIRLRQSPNEYIRLNYVYLERSLMVCGARIQSAVRRQSRKEQQSPKRVAEKQTSMSLGAKESRWAPSRRHFVPHERIWMTGNWLNLRYKNELYYFDSYLITIGWKTGVDSVPNKRFSCSVRRWNTCLGTLERRTAVGIKKSLDSYYSLVLIISYWVRVLIQF